MIYKILVRRLLSRTAHLYSADLEIYCGGEAAGNQPRRSGTITFFNAEYRREAASARGRGFMTYERAPAPLRRAIAGVIAAGNVISASLVVQVFE
jgi:hypothetical protein